MRVYHYVDAPGMVLSDTMRFEEGENPGHFFHISKRLFDFDDLEKGSIATVVMSVDQSILSSICGNGTKRDNSINFIMNQKQEIISYPDEDFTGISINPDLSTEEFVKVSGYLKNKKIALNQYEDADTGWIFCNAYDRDYMLRDVTRTQGMQLGITVLLLSFALVLIIYTIRNMDASVKSVVQGMQEVKKGNLDVLVPVQSFDEIGTITDNFNEMMLQAAKTQTASAAARIRESQRFMINSSSFYIIYFVCYRVGACPDRLYACSSCRLPKNKVSL